MCWRVLTSIDLIYHDRDIFERSPRSDGGIFMTATNLKSSRAANNLISSYYFAKHYSILKRSYR